MDKDLELQPQWLSYTQTRKITGLSRGTIHKILDSGAVKAAKVGSRTLINRQSLVEYLEDHSYARGSKQKPAALEEETTGEGRL